MLEPWQRERVTTHLRELVRGLIHSDGCRNMNWVTTGGRRYEYSRYQFKNESNDIVGIVSDALDLLGIEWTRNSRNSISVAKRASVAMLDEFVGPKT